MHKLGLYFAAACIAVQLLVSSNIAKQVTERIRKRFAHAMAVITVMTLLALSGRYLYQTEQGALQESIKEFAASLAEGH